jgi:hypothetical protein
LTGKKDNHRKNQQQQFFHRGFGFEIIIALSGMIANLILLDNTFPDKPGLWLVLKLISRLKE